MRSQKDLRSQTVGPMVYLKPIMPVRSGYIPVKNALRPDVAALHRVIRGNGCSVPNYGNGACGLA